MYELARVLPQATVQKACALYALRILDACIIGVRSVKNDIMLGVVTSFYSLGFRMGHENHAREC